MAAVAAAAAAASADSIRSKSVSSPSPSPSPSSASSSSSLPSHSSSFLGTSLLLPSLHRSPTGTSSRPLHYRCHRPHGCALASASSATVLQNAARELAQVWELTPHLIPL
jgi:hypothetical protein